MKIEQIKINGVQGVPGFCYADPVVSWQVTDTEAVRQTCAGIELAAEPSFGQVLYKKAGDLNSAGEALEYALAPRTAYYLRITVTADQRETVVSNPICFETGKMDEPFAAEWIAPKQGDECHPLMSRHFRISKPVLRARAYIGCCGVYELYLNGRKVGDELLAPYFNDYRFAMQVCTYPLELREENCLQILVGGGWYLGRFGLDGRKCNYGDRLAAIGEIHIDYVDGTHEVIVTDDTWTYSPSDIVESGIYDGEVIDRTRYTADRPVRRVEVLADQSRALLTDRFSPPVRVQERLPVQSIISTPAGETVLDFGQNFAGYVEFDADFPAGTEIVLDHGEILQEGNFYRDNYRTARSQFRYISSGERELVRAHFTYFGFRYVRVTCSAPVQKEQFRGCVVYSDMTRTGYLATGNKKINRLLDNALWGMKSNFLDMPTDCPQRDERLGWTGDAQVFAPTASYFMDTRAFYNKYCKELRSTQLQMNGGIPNFLPSFGQLSGTGSVWGDVATFLPYTLFTQFGDRKALARYYPMMRDWVEYVRGEDQKNGNRNLYLTGFHFGDWLALDGVTSQSMKGGTDDYYIASMYYYRSAQIVAETAGLLGYGEDERRYRELEGKIRQAILEEYFTATGRLAVPTQTGFLVALRFGVYVDRQVLIDQMLQRLRQDCFRIKGGFVGAPRMCTTLAEAGLTDLAYDYLLQEDFPSWLYCVNLGATTIWERWNSVLPDGRISGTGMNSLNHYAYGSVAEFLFAHGAGIQPVTPGFRKARIAPSPEIRLGKLDCTYQSASGTYRSAWEILPNGQLQVDITIPFGCSAQVVLPECGEEIGWLSAGTYHFRYTPKRDYRRPYGPQTPLDRIAKDSRALNILFAKAPAFGGMAAGDDREKCSVTLSMLPYMHYIPHDPERLQEALTELYTLEYEEF